MKFYILARYNPQLGVYYIKCGQMSKVEAKKRGEALYGHTWIMRLSSIGE